MNIAENVTDPGPVKMHQPRRARLVQPEIETFALKQREHIVKERVVVGERHHRTDRRHQNVRLKTLVLLRQAQAAVRDRRNTRQFVSISSQRRQPHHCARSRHVARAPSALHFHPPMNHDLRLQPTQASQEHQRTNPCSCHPCTTSSSAVRNHGTTTISLSAVAAQPLTQNNSDCYHPVSHSEANALRPLCPLWFTLQATLPGSGHS